jgi:GWxTD domain-containing protein
MRRYTKISLYGLVLIWIFSCKTGQMYTSKPAKNANNPDSDLLEVNAVAYHKKDSLSILFLQIKNDHLLYKRPDTSLAFYAELHVSYRLFNEENTHQIIDSSSLRMIDRSGPETVVLKSLHHTFSLPTQKGKGYVLELEVLDVNKKTRYETKLNINRQSEFSPQNFLVTLNDTVSYTNNFLKRQKVMVRFANPAISKVTVSCYVKEFGPALPPFSVKENTETLPQPDSSFTMDLNTNSFNLTMPEKGFYFVKPVGSAGDGLTLYTVDETFPGVGNSSDMIHCTRYIMNREEYENCLDAADKKAAIDKFWLGVGGSNERARELLRRYYGRVKDANKYFTSYTQGWKSDRGMIFIVFGAPNNTYRSKKDEIWVYGNEANPSALRFVFNKNQNPFSENDFVLERSTFYKEAYYQAVDYWRQGNVYIDGRK